MLWRQCVVWNTEYIIQLVGVYEDTLQAQAGCDSVSILNLTVEDINIGDTTSLIACDSSEWNGVMYYVSGVYVDTLQSVVWL